jgi:ribosomal protein S18 acetylase RimI-like enzyme
MIHVRDAVGHDAARIAELNRAFNGVETAPAFVVGSFGELVLVGELHGTVVGFACLQILQSVCYQHPWAELTELFVSPESRQYGVGNALVEEAKRRAWQEGCTEIVLRTSLTNVGGRDFFRITGFTETQQLLLRKVRPPS